MLLVPAVVSIKSLAASLFLFIILSFAYILYDGPIFTRVSPLLPNRVSPQRPLPTATASPATYKHAVPDPVRPIIDDIAQYFIDFPLQKPYKGVFGELGRRTRILRDWLTHLDAQTNPDAQDVVLVNRVAATLFPYLEDQPRFPNTARPLSDLRSSFEPGTAGIVIPAGDATIRYAAHLILSLRSVLSSTLPVEVAYAGDKDLSPANRQLLVRITEKHAPSSQPLRFLDLNTLFNGTAQQFTTTKSGGWATKAFAALGSSFEKVIVLDADAVFLQPPEVLLSHTSFQKTGAFLFHDRLLWQHGFQDRHQWWKDQIRRPSPTLEKSLVWSEDYAEEADSGVVLLDKGRIDVLMGLLHICWQNSYEVREEITYKITYGDKESWWMGLEMAGSGYDMAEHYGGIVGWQQEGKDGKSGTVDRVCSFVIAHVDERDRLVWYNGGLLKNKLTDPTGYEVPSHWQLNGSWEKGGSKQEMSCMVNGTIQALTEQEMRILKHSIEKAKVADGIFTAQ